MTTTETAALTARAPSRPSMTRSPDWCRTAVVATGRAGSWKRRATPGMKLQARPQPEVRRRT